MPLSGQAKPSQANLGFNQVFRGANELGRKKER